MLAEETVDQESAGSVTSSSATVVCRGVAGNSADEGREADEELVVERFYVAAVVGFPGGGGGRDGRRGGGDVGAGRPLIGVRGPTRSVAGCPTGARRADTPGAPAADPVPSVGVSGCGCESFRCRSVDDGQVDVAFDEPEILQVEVVDGGGDVGGFGVVHAEEELVDVASLVGLGDGANASVGRAKQTGPKVSRRATSGERRAAASG